MESLFGELESHILAVWPKTITRTKIITQRGEEECASLLVFLVTDEPI